jgi:hypothetical protein
MTKRDAAANPGASSKRQCTGQTDSVLSAYEVIVFSLHMCCCFSCTAIFIENTALQEWLKSKKVWWDESLIKLRSPLRPPEKGDKIPDYLAGE